MTRTPKPDNIDSPDYQHTLEVIANDHVPERLINQMSEDKQNFEKLSERINKKSLFAKFKNLFRRSA